ncbi:hypothetical protein CMALT394_540011 [Carnobacterium maltaromaticum]|nr:hypothetical protein CMALT394_540011 [Carnobacterium maltaromaticum]
MILFFYFYKVKMKFILWFARYAKTFVYVVFKIHMKNVLVIHIKICH